MRVSWLGTAIQDVRYAGRVLRKNPGFTAIAVLTLALGIGANTAIFSVVYGVLLKPLPYLHPEQLIRVFESSASQPKFPMSAGDFQDYRAQNSTLSGLALYTRLDLELSLDDQPELLSALRVTSGFFDVLGVRPMLGREFRREDEAQDNHHSIILSHGLWQRRFHSDPGVLGKPVTLSGEAFTVVGVMPPGVQHVGGDYRSMPHGETVDFWWPVTLRPQDERGSHYMNAIGRLKPGVQPGQAVTDFNVIAERLARQFPDMDKDWRIAIQPLHEEIVGRSRTSLWMLFGGCLCIADRLRECGEPVAGAVVEAGTGDGRAGGGGSRALAYHPPTADGKPAAGGGEQRGGNCAGEMGRGRAREAWLGAIAALANGPT